MDPEKVLFGFVKTGRARGYPGEITMALPVSPTRTIEGLVVVDHKETYSFFHRVLRNELWQSLRGKFYLIALFALGIVPHASLFNRRLLCNYLYHLLPVTE